MSHDAAARRISENVARVRERIARAAERVGRSPEQVRLIAVTKYVGPELLPALLAAGCLDFGESRPQELWKKAAALAADPPATPPRWHLIGHLQRNKLDRTLPLVSLVHSGDSERLLEAMNAWAERAGRRLPVLLEVNVSGEANKGGFAPEALPALGQRLPELANLDVRGLMAMASLASAEVEGDVARLEFARLRALRDAAERDWAGAGRLPELSIGMSGDYELAIEEGATMVRVGSALFEGLR